MPKQEKKQVKALRRLETVLHEGRRGEWRNMVRDAQSTGVDPVGLVLRQLSSETKYDAIKELIAILADLKDPRAIDAIVIANGSKESNIARQAFDALRSIGASTEQVAACLLNGTDDQRFGAALLLWRFQDSSAIPALIAALQDPDPRVRRTAAEGLGSLGAGSAIDSLVAALADSNTGVRRTAAEAIGLIGRGANVEVNEFGGRGIRIPLEEGPGAPQAIEPLKRLLIDPEPSVRDKAAEALEYLGAAPAAVQEFLGGIRGGLGEPYCSQRCYGLGGRTIATHVVQGWMGDCSVCRLPLRLGVGLATGGSMVCYKPGQFLFFHQEQRCVDAVRAEVAKSKTCVVCGAQLDAA